MDWEEALQSLADKVGVLAAEAGLGFDQFVRSDHIEPGEPYLEVITSPHEKLYLEPAEFAAARVPATVWLYNYPSMSRVRLVGPDEGGEWALQSSDGVPFHRNLDAQGFRQLVEDLGLRAA